MPRLVMSLLGDFSVALDGAPVAGFTYDKVRALLAYLAVETGRPHRREHLADLLWPGYPERRARQSLSNALSVLRNAIDDRAAEPPFLLVSHRELEFNRESDYWLDVAAFTAHYRTAHAEATTEDTAEVLEHLQRAATLYRGNFLENLLIGDSVPFGEWALLQRENLRRQMLEILARLAENALIGGDPEAALQSASRQVALDAWRESAHRQVMCALILSGQRNGAIAHYEELRRTLAVDLGVEPEATTMALAAMLKADNLGAKTAIGDAHRDRDLTRQTEQVMLRSLHAQPGERYLHQRSFLQALAVAALGIKDAAARPVGVRARPQDAPTDAGWLHLSDNLAPEPGEPPFMGLQPFDVADADRFFGREALTVHLLRRLDRMHVVAASEPAVRSSFLAIVGASGSGKSSLVRAGLVAAVRRGKFIPGSDSWAVHLLTPTAHPLEALTVSLTRDSRSRTTATTLTDSLARDPHGLHLYLSSHGASDAPTLVVVDQFEELFTMCRNTRERKAFIDNLMTTAQAGQGNIVVIALRADFYDRCAEYPALREALSRDQVYIGPMTPDALRHAIEEPAGEGGWSFEPGLLNLLLRDIGADGMQPPEPGALPLLSHALLETWKRRRGRTLTLSGYVEAGGVRKAIAKTADAVYTQLTPIQQDLARNLFLRLTELGENTQDTRRRITRDEIMSDPATAPDVVDVLDILAGARLITLAHDTVEVAHEALIREWPLLRTWLEQDREGLRIHRHLTESAREWERLDRDPSDLYRGARLAQAAEWADAHPAAMNPLERTYLSASQAEIERVGKEREAQRRRELQAAQRLAETETRRATERGRMLRWIGGVAVLLFLAVVAAAVLGSRARLTARENAELADTNADIAATAVTVSEMEASQRAAAEAARAAEETARIEGDKQRAAAEAARRQEAEQRSAAEMARSEAISQTQIARVNVLTLLSDKLIAEQHDTALLFSAQAYDILDIPLTRSSLLTVLESKRGFAGFLHTNVGSPDQLTFSPDGHTLAVSGNDRTIQLWDLGTRKPIGDLMTGHHSTAGALAFSPDGNALASGSCALFDAGGACLEGEIFLWDLSTGDVQVYPAIHNTYVSQLAFSPSGDLLVSRGMNRVVLWDTTTAEPVHKFMDIPETQMLSAFSLSPDGATLATGVCDVIGERYYDDCVQSDVILWDVASREMRQRITGPAHPVISWAFGSDAGLLASAGCETITLTPEQNVCERGYVQLWDVATGRAVGPPLSGHTDWVSWSGFVRQDSALITISIDGTIRLWDTATGGPLVTPITDLAGSTEGADLTPDGTLLATATSQEPNVRLWDVAKISQTDPLRTGSVFARASSYLLSMAINPEETIIATGSFPGEIYLWDMATGDAIGAPLIGHTDWVYSVAFSPDGTTLASGSVDTTIRLWDVGTGESTLPPLEGHTGTVKRVAFNPAGTLLASGSDDTTMRLWDARTGELLSVSPGMSMAPAAGLGLWDVAFSPDGTLLAGAVALPEKVAILWDIRDATAPRVVARLPTDAAGGVTNVEFSPDGSRLAIGAGLEGTVLLWDTRTHELIGAPIAAHQRTIWPLAFNPDGTLLASGGLDNAIRLMDAATGQLIGPPLITDSQAPAGQSVGTVHSLVFAESGGLLFSSNCGGFIHRWDLNPESWKAQACFLAGRNLTRAEWARYLQGMPYKPTCDDWPVEE